MGITLEECCREFDEWWATNRCRLQNMETEMVNEPIGASDQIISEHEDYEDLARILNMAYDQAASGKGKERHANGKPFDRQPIMEIARMTGLAYHTGQAMKKIQEAHKLLKIKGKEAAIRELLGVEVYVAAAIKLIEEMED